MMLRYKLLSDTGKTRKYLVIGDTESGTVEVDKKTREVKTSGDFSCMFSQTFINSLVVNTLDKFEINPPDSFVYGVG